jgi:hypothetical protein
MTIISDDSIESAPNKEMRYDEPIETNASGRTSGRRNGPRGTFLKTSRARLAATLAGLAIAASGLVAVAPNSAAQGMAKADVAQGSTSDRPSMPAMTLGKAVKMTPPEMARQRHTAVDAVVGPTTDARASAVSPNWSGLLTSGTFQGIAGEWTVPSVQVTTANKYSCTWVGLDGYSNQSLIQTGTEQDSYLGHTRYYAWIETLPANQERITYTNGSDVPVAPGDVMWAYIYETSANEWAIYLQDLTQGWTLSTSTSYSSPGATVEWVQEATTVGGVFAPPPVFSKVNFASLQVLEAGKWYGTTMKASSEVDMVQNGHVYATPSAPTTAVPQKFSISYG